MSAAVEVTGEAFHRRNKLAALKGREPAARITAEHVGGACYRYTGLANDGAKLLECLGAKP